jgi:hypothetical protein
LHQAYKIVQMIYTLSPAGLCIFHDTLKVIF